MSKSLLIPEDQQLRHFDDEFESIIAVRRTNIAEEVLYMGFEAGEAICSSPLYKKYSKGQGEFLEHIAEKFHVSRAQIGYFIQAHEKWGDVEKCREQLQKKLDKPVIFWSEVVKALPSVSKRMEKPKVCKHCPIEGHCKNS